MVGKYQNGNIETYCVKGVIVGINQENPFIEENTMITIKVNGMNKEIFQDIVLLVKEKNY